MIFAFCIKFLKKFPDSGRWDLEVHFEDWHIVTCCNYIWITIAHVVHALHQLNIISNLIIYFYCSHRYSITGLPITRKHDVRNYE